MPGPDDLVDDRPEAEIPDDRLRLIVTCCHPALDRSAQVALTLRLMCGLSTAEVARAFLVSEPTMAARITRAKKKIAVARIPYRVPPAAELPERVDAVLSVVHLLFTTGHTTPAGEELVRRDLVERSVRAGPDAAPAAAAGPGRGRAAGAAAAHRRPAGDPHRRRTAGCSCSRSRTATRWDRGAIAEGVALVREALRARPPTRYALQAAIAAVHAESPSWDDTDWREIVALYDVLTQVWPSPVVALNRAVAVGFARGAGGRAGRARRAGGGAAAGRLRLPARGAGRLPPAARPAGRGPGGLRGGAAAHRERRRAGLPRRPAARAGSGRRPPGVPAARAR